MSITIHQVRETVRSPPASAMSLKPNAALWAVGGRCWSWSMLQWAMVDSGDEQLSYFTQLAVFSIHVSFFALISKWGLFSRYLQCFQSENEKVPSISHQLFFMVFRASSTEINTQKKTPASRYIWIKKCILNIYLPIVFFKWMTNPFGCFWMKVAIYITLVIELLCFLGLFPWNSDRAQAPSPRVQGAVAESPGLKPPSSLGLLSVFPWPAIGAWRIGEWGGEPEPFFLEWVPLPTSFIVGLWQFEIWQSMTLPVADPSWACDARDHRRGEFLDVLLHLATLVSAAAPGHGAGGAAVMPCKAGRGRYGKYANDLMRQVHNCLWNLMKTMRNLHINAFTSGPCTLLHILELCICQGSAKHRLERG